tara:strand:+ start:1081 stop:3057 length:1977 start_codon:yes stop_codon:yes gene_type:complete
MAINFLNNVDYNQNQLLHAKIENQASDALAGTPVDGQLYYNTSATPGLKVGENGAWVFVGDNTDTNNYVTGGSISAGTVTLTRQGLSSVTFAINNDEITNGAGYITSASLPTVGNGELTVQGTGALGGTGTFTANQSGNSTISVTHDAFGTAGTYAYPSSITTNSTGHITAITGGSAPATPSDATITLTAGNILDGGGAFTLNQSGNETITFDLAAGGAGAATYGSTSDSIKIDTITLDAYGRVTNVATGATGQVNSIGSGSSTTISIGGTAIVPTVSAVTAAVANAGTALATGDQIYDFVTGQIANIPSGLSFEGSWNASTDSPDLSTATPDNGQFWIVSVAGTTDLDGIDEWAVGDWAIYVSTGAGTDGWQKVDNSSTLSGFGDTNQVTYWTSTGNVAGDTGFTFNPTSNNLTVGGSVTWSGGSSAESNTAYDNSITALNVTGSTTKTLTATQQDGGTLTASWTDNNTEYLMMTATTLGLGKLEDNTTQTVAANSVSATASRTYGIQKNSSNQLVVNVPWANTNSGGTVTGVTGVSPIAVTSSSTTPAVSIATASAGTIGAGAVAAGTGISVAYASGIATVTNTQNNSDNTATGTITAGSLSGTVTHNFGINTIVQTINSSGDTVFCDISRTATTSVATIATAEATAITILVQKIG